MKSYFLNQRQPSFFFLAPDKIFVAAYPTVTSTFFLAWRTPLLFRHWAVLAQKKIWARPQGSNVINISQLWSCHCLLPVTVMITSQQ